MRPPGWTAAGFNISGLVIGLMGLALGLSPVRPAAAQQQYELNRGRWRQEKIYSRHTPRGKLQAIRKALAEGKAQRAQTLASRWIKRYRNHPLVVEAYLLRGDAKSARGDYYDALYDYEYLIRTYPASEQYHTALEREYQIARLYTSGLNRRFLGFRLLPADGEGEELLIRIQERAPGSEVGEKASMTLADYYFDQSQMDQAADAYDLFLQNYPQSPRRERAMLRLIQANLARYKGPRFNATGLIEAAQRLKMYRDEFPAAAQRIGAQGLLVRLDESLALKDLITARWYERRHRPISAAYIFKRIVHQHPRTAAADQALQRLKKLHVPLAKLPGPTPPG